MLLVITLISIIASTGFGLLAKNVIGYTGNVNSFDTWLGISLILIILDITHIFSPINWIVSLVLLVVGVVLFFIFINHDRNCFTLKVRRSFYPFVMIILVWGMLSVIPANSFDLGLYHLNLVRWINEYPVILGLGNLHGRLAFNQSYFNLVALMNLFPHWDMGFSAAKLFFMTLGLITLLEFSRDGGFDKIFISTVLVIGIGFNASESGLTNADLGMAIMQIPLFLLLYIVVTKKFDPKDSCGEFYYLVFIGVALVSIKLSSIIYVAFTILTAFFLMRSVVLSQKIKTTAVLLFCLFGFLVHAFTSVLLSGAPFFPSTFGIMDVAWAVPYEYIKGESDWIYSWAKNPQSTPDKVLGNWDWFIPWAKIQPRPLLYTIFVLSSLNLCLIIARQIGILYFNKSILYLLIPILSSVLFWILTAPDIRFLGFIPTFYIIVSCAIFFSVIRWLNIKISIGEINVIIGKNFNASINLGNKKIIYQIFLLVLIGCLLKISGWRGQAIKKEDYKYPVSEINYKATLSGLTVGIPITPNTKCWDSTLPCTPYFNEKLRAYETAIFKGYSVKD
jgi:hypothetical protein